MKINYRYRESYSCPAFSIKQVSIYKGEDEFLFPPFSFFRILKFISAEGTQENPVVVELEVIPNKGNFAKYLKHGGKIIYDSNENCMTGVL